jgi:uncharacterized iron-regulated membrane protein
MELSEQEKERIAAEEKVRFEAQRQLMREHYRGWRYGHRCRGGWFGGVFKVLLLVFLFSAIFWHPWRPWHYGYYADCGAGRPAVQQQTSPEAAPNKK